MQVGCVVAPCQIWVRLLSNVVYGVHTRPGDMQRAQRVLRNKTLFDLVSCQRAVVLGLSRPQEFMHTYYFWSGLKVFTLLY